MSRVRRGTGMIVPGLSATFAALAALRIADPGVFPLVVLEAYVPYATLGAVATALAAIGTRRRRSAVLGASSAAVMLALVAPRGLEDRRAAGSTGPVLRVMTANTKLGAASPAALMAVLRRWRPDLVSLQELTPTLVRGLDEQGLRSLYPAAVLRPRWGAAGTGLFAPGALAPASPPSPTTFALSAGRLHTTHGSIRAVAVHAAAPTSPGATRLWRRDLRALGRPAPDGYSLLAGDFNATLDHRDLGRLLDAGYRDAAAATGTGLLPTWPAGRLLPPPVTIDHVLVGRRLDVVSVHVVDVAGSDHRAVIADLQLATAHGDAPPLRARLHSSALGR